MCVIIILIYYVIILSLSIPIGPSLGTPYWQPWKRAAIAAEGKLAAATRHAEQRTEECVREAEDARSEAKQLEKSVADNMDLVGNAGAYVNFHGNLM